MSASPSACQHVKLAEWRNDSMRSALTFMYAIEAFVFIGFFFWLIYIIWRFMKLSDASLAEST